MSVAVAMHTVDIFLYDSTTYFQKVGCLNYQMDKTGRMKGHLMSNHIQKCWAGPASEHL